MFYFAKTLSILYIVISTQVFAKIPVATVYGEIIEIYIFGGGAGSPVARAHQALGKSRARRREHAVPQG